MSVLYMCARASSACALVLVCGRQTVSVRQAVCVCVCEDEGGGGGGRGERDRQTANTREREREAARDWVEGGRGCETARVRDKAGENNLVWPYFSVAFSFFIFPSFLSYLHRNKRLLARGNKDDEKKGEEGEEKRSKRKKGRREKEAGGGGGVQEKGKK